VRLALLGPSQGDVGALARAAHTALVRLGADRVVYLGADDALDAVAFAWARLIGALEPLEVRAPELREADADDLDRALEAERHRARLSCLHTLVGPSQRAVELVHDRVLLLVEDKRELDEEDLLPASFIAFGKGEPLIRRVGSRVFFCPGSPSKRSEGVLVLDEGQEAGAVLATLHDVDGAVLQREQLDTARSLKMKVQA
jgi:hypothetical protein